MRRRHGIPVSKSGQFREGDVIIIGETGLNKVVTSVEGDEVTCRPNRWYWRAWARARAYWKAI